VAETCLTWCWSPWRM